MALSSLLLLASCIAPGHGAGLTRAPIKPRLDNGLALTPPMGWNSYNHYSCSPNETIIRSNAEALVQLGLSDVGYYYVTPDCGWASDNRTSSGTLTWNAALFPSGFPALADYVHGLGLGFGVYSDSGILMCGTDAAGSLSHETTDAQTFASWGADLVKYDNCYSDAATGYPDVNYAPSTSPEPRMANMSQALLATGREILFAICEWGVDFPSAWAPAIGNTWRITNDIIPAWSTIYRQVNQFVPSASFAGPGQWPDLDMLEVGNNIFTIAEEQTHFSLWAIAKSPLIIGAALKDEATSINQDSLDILLNKQVISYNQDSLGVAANLTKRDTEAGLDVWSGPLSGGRTVAALVNWNDFAVTATLNLSDVGLSSAGMLVDVWNGVNASNVKTSYTSTIPTHGTLLVELDQTTEAGNYPASIFASSTDTTTTFSRIFSPTSSTETTITVTLTARSASHVPLEISNSASNKGTQATLEAGKDTLSIPMALVPGEENSITISHPNGLSGASISSITVDAASSTIIPATAFELTGGTELTTCSTGLCAPVGARVTWISPTSAATVVMAPSTTASSSASTVSKLVEVIYTNNDIAFSTSWTTGRNARNVTIQVNDASPVRLEVPLSGRSSELFSVGDGWEDSASLSILVGGFSQTANNTIVVSNVGGDEGVQTYAPDIVGLRIYG